MGYPRVSAAWQGEDRQDKLFSEPHCTPQNCNLRHAKCKFYAENWMEEKESMNINIKSIKINCSGQGEQKRWVFKRPSGLIPKHIFFSSFECVIKKMSTKSLQGLPLGFCLLRGPWSWCCKAAIQRDHKVFPATTSFIFLPVRLQFLKLIISPRSLKRLLNYPYRKALPENNASDPKSPPLQNSDSGFCSDTF